MHVWKGVTNVTEVLADGYSVLRNVGYDNTSWYLDNLGVRWVETPPAPAPRAVCVHCVCTAYALHVHCLCNLHVCCVHTAYALRSRCVCRWDEVYANEPCRGVPDALCPQILGGHGEMWGETVDASDLQQTVWPRLAAVAEKLWSPRAATTDASAAAPRIARFRCLLNERGVAAAPVANAMARSAPTGPGSCLAQRRRRRR